MAYLSNPLHSANIGGVQGLGRDRRAEPAVAAVGASGGRGREPGHRRSSATAGIPPPRHLGRTPTVVSGRDRLPTADPAKPFLSLKPGEWDILCVPLCHDRAAVVARFKQARRPTRSPTSRIGRIPAARQGGGLGAALFRTPLVLLPVAEHDERRAAIDRRAAPSWCRAGHCPPCRATTRLAEGVKRERDAGEATWALKGGRRRSAGRNAGRCRAAASARKLPGRHAADYSFSGGPSRAYAARSLAVSTNTCFRQVRLNGGPRFWSRDLYLVS